MGVQYTKKSMSDQAAVADKQLEKELDVSTSLAYERTRLAYERTLQAWIRTGTSLVTFGFSVYKFFQIDRPSQTPRTVWIGAREFGEILVLLGLSSLILATAQYRGQIRELARVYPGARKRSFSMVISGVLVALALFALVGMFLHR